MSLTLKAIGSVSVGDNAPEWTFGGGTSLAIDLEHRVSYDIDAFMDSAKAIRALVPVRNEVTREISWNPETQQSEFHWPGHYLKLFVYNTGEIDFLSSATLVDSATVPFEFQGKVIARERPAEVMAKKIYHRGATFKARDVFDLAATYLTMREELSVAADSPYLTAEVIARARLRIQARATVFREEIYEETNPTDFGRSYLDDAIQLSLDALDFMEHGP